MVFLTVFLDLIMVPKHRIHTVLAFTSLNLRGVSQLLILLVNSVEVLVVRCKVSQSGGRPSWSADPIHSSAHPLYLLLSYFVCLIVYSCLVFVKFSTIFCAFFALGILGINFFSTVLARRDLGHYILLAFRAQVFAAPSNGFISYAISCPLLVVAIGAVNVNLHFGAELTVVRQPPVISKFIVQLFLQFALFSTRTLALDGFVFGAWSTSLWFLITLSFVV